ncbi:MAG: ATP-binding protein [Verrucomicrobia bacterium]|nr:ATP-binding protein [Verrucomicrobiota bacterium]
MIDHEIEIQDIPALTEGQSAQLDMHSLLNALSVLTGELMIIGHELTGDPEHLAPALMLCKDVQRALTNRAATLEHIARVPEHGRAILDCIAQAAAAHPEAAATPAHAKSVDNINSVLDILEVRAQEILTRANAPDAWLSMPIAYLQSDLRSVFRAIEKNSHGRYRILYNLAAKELTDYYVNFHLTAIDGQAIRMPLVFKDVMRDLLANARKFTPPGGTINAGLLETPEHLSFSVEDTGRGIPADELETVVHFGHRARNSTDVHGKGGGFGLTKAFLVTKQFGGRLRIASKLDVGTRIRIDLPRPAHLPRLAPHA